MNTEKQSVFRRWYGSRLVVVLESILIGAVAGLVVSGFRYLLSQADALRRWIYGAFLLGSAFWTGVWAGLLVITGLFLGWTIKVRPMIKGSGIPQVKGLLLDQLQMRWATELPLKIITGALGLGAGLSLGREGPSIQVGSYVGMGLLSVFRRPKDEAKILIVAASAAGISAAFSAPLSGILFALEELVPSFSPLFIASALGASMAADAVAGLFFGATPVFDFAHITVLSFSNIHWVILLGISCALLGDVFKRALYLSQDFYEKIRIPPLFRPILPLLVSIPLGFLCMDALGGGHNLIESLSMEGRPFPTLLIIFGVKLVFTALCYGSGTSGGIFLPLLACGALLGGAMGESLAAMGFITHEQTLNFMILGMAAFFTGVVKAPLTGIVLIFEMSGNFNHMGNLVLVCLTTFVLSDLIASRPVYTVLLERMLKGAAHHDKPAPH
ncbi:MAG: ClC family H(+)/Cl(-) exchange transporter [Treponema sp.]|nr:ClC family H(+)/Cl(-) exchange transporter [Treponema sp.]